MLGLIYGKIIFYKILIRKEKIYTTIALEAIRNVGYKIESEDSKKLIIQAKTGFSITSFGQKLDIQIKDSTISLTTRTKTPQVTDWGEGEKISKNLFDEIRNISDLK